MPILSQRRYQRRYIYINTFATYAQEVERTNRNINTAQAHMPLHVSKRNINDD